MDNYEKKMKIWFCISVIAIATRCYLHYISKQDTQPYEKIEQTFDEGEHIISVPIDNPKKEVQTYEYHDGYKVIDIENKYILYVNEEPVKCIGYLDNDEQVHFTEFGEPVELEKTETNTKILKLGPQEELYINKED